MKDLEEHLMALLVRIIIMKDLEEHFMALLFRII